MFWREIRETDLANALALEPRNLGAEIIGRDAALRVWQSLFENRAFRGIVIERDGSSRGDPIIAAGAGVIVQPDFMSAEIANPRSQLNSRIVAGVAQGQSVLLEWSDVGRANAGDGIDIANLMGSFQPGLSPETIAELSAVLAESFLEVHRGFRLNRLLREMIGTRELRMTEASGIFRTLAMFPENESAIRLTTRADAFKVSHSTAISMFCYRVPELRLHDADQQLLLAALRGGTDAELSQELGLSLPAVKKRWLSIFQRVADIKPEILAVPESMDEGARGPQKRHHVLAYVRAHPEELRPYDWRHVATVAERPGKKIGSS